MTPYGDTRQAAGRWGKNTQPLNFDIIDHAIADLTRQHERLSAATTTRASTEAAAILETLDALTTALCAVRHALHELQGTNASATTDNATRTNARGAKKERLRRSWDLRAENRAGDPHGR